jgi:hypothetical protein
MAKKKTKKKAVKAGPFKLRTTCIGIPKARAANIRAREVRVRQFGAAEVRITQVASGKPEALQFLPLIILPVLQVTSE